MGGSPAPAPDPRMAEAALLSAQTGEELLAFMRGQAEISNAWAAEDRSRWDTMFRPLEDQFVQEAANYDTSQRRELEADNAQSDVQQAMHATTLQNERRQAAMGVRPGSGRSNEGARRSASDMGLAVAGARNTAKRKVEADGFARKAAAVNLGSGYSVNPATSLGMATSSGAAGHQGAMSGYGQQANIFGQQHNQQMQQWQADQNTQSGLFGGLGTLAGLGLQMGGFLSTEKVKKDKSPAKDSLGAVRKMRVDNWTYKEGHGDEGSHVGPYAEEFAEATGLGDGNSIQVIDAIGTALGAIKELDAKVERLAS